MKGDTEHMASGLKLTIELVPRPCWHSNLHTSMPRATWDHLRRLVYTKYNYHCGICQASNVQMICHEIWQYDDEQHIQKIARFMRVNQCSREDYEAHEKEAWRLFAERNKHSWTTDLGKYAHLVTQKER